MNGISGMLGNSDAILDYWNFAGFSNIRG